VRPLRSRIPLLVAALALAAVVIALTTRSPEESVVGVVIAVDAQGLVDVRGFTIRTDDARTLTFRVGDLENPVEFPPGHLVEHQATSEQVRVRYRREAETLVAVRLEDAQAP